MRYVGAAEAYLRDFLAEIHVIENRICLLSNAISELERFLAFILIFSEIHELRNVIW